MKGVCQTKVRFIALGMVLCSSVFFFLPALASVYKNQRYYNKIEKICQNKTLTPIYISVH